MPRRPADAGWCWRPGTPRKFAEAIAKHLGIFDAVLATDGKENLTSKRKTAAHLWPPYGEAGFDYFGNSRQRSGDIRCGARGQRGGARPQRGALAGGAWPRADRDAEADGQDRPKHAARASMAEERTDRRAGRAQPRIFQLSAMLVDCILAFISFSAAASAIYIVNDFFDLALDRRHPTKRNRPFASGLLSMRFGIASVAVLLVLSFAVAAFLPSLFLGVLCGYLVATTAYSLSIKRMLLLDVLMLAGLYTTRILAGAAATGINVSFWLLAFSTFFFLSLALVKRYVELRSSVLVPGERIAGRGYRAEDQEIIAQAGMASAFSSALVLALYIDSSARARTPIRIRGWSWPLAPTVLYLTMRIWILARRDELHDDPVVFIVRDWRSQVVVAAGAIMLVMAGLI